MKLLLVLFAFVIAAQAALPSRNKVLEDDVAVALTQVHDLDIVTLEFTNSLQYFSLRVDLEVKPISVEIIGQLNELNVSSSEVALVQSDFDASFTIIQDGVRDLDNRLRQLRSTVGSMQSSLQDSDWNNLRNLERRFRDDTNAIHAKYNETETNLKMSLVVIENDLVKSLANESSEDFAAVFSNWGRIVDIFEYAGREVTDWKIVYDVRVESTKNAVDVVLDQVARRRHSIVKSGERH